MGHTLTKMPNSVYLTAECGLKAMLLDFLPEQPDRTFALLPSRQDVRSVGIEATSPLASRLAGRRGLAPLPALHCPHSYAEPPRNLFLCKAMQPQGFGLFKALLLVGLLFALRL